MHVSGGDLGSDVADNQATTNALQGGHLGSHLCGQLLSIELPLVQSLRLSLPTYCNRRQLPPFIFQFTCCGLIFISDIFVSEGTTH